MVPDNFQEELARSFRDVMDASPDCLLVSDLDTHRYLYVNETVCRQAGYTRDELCAMTLADLTGQSPEEVRALFTEVRAAGRRGVTEAPRITLSKDGSRKGWWEAHHRCVQIAGRWLVVTVSREVSRRVLAERAAERTRRIYAALSEANEAIIRSDNPRQLYQWVCEAAIASGGMTTASILLPQPGDDRLQVVAFAGVGKREMYRAVISTSPDKPEGRGLNGTAFRSGEPMVTDDFLADQRTGPWHGLIRPTRLRSAASVPIVRNGASVGVLYLGAREARAFDEEILSLLTRMTRNLAFALQAYEQETERRRAEERVRYLATHDPLTGLPNRALFGELLEQALSEARRSDEVIGVMFVDLDNFKEVNDSLGHAAGDELLERLAQRLSGALRESDVLARLGGDEFVVLLKQLRQPRNAARVAEKLTAAAVAPIHVNGQVCEVSASIGISLYPVDGDNERALMKSADAAMYRAKDKGKNTYAFFSDNSA